MKKHWKEKRRAIIKSSSMRRNYGRNRSPITRNSREIEKLALPQLQQPGKRKAEGWGSNNTSRQLSFPLEQPLRIDTPPWYHPGKDWQKIKEKSARKWNKREREVG